MLTRVLTLRFAESTTCSIWDNEIADAVEVPFRDGLCMQCTFKPSLLTLFLAAETTPVITYNFLQCRIEWRGIPHPKQHCVDAGYISITQYDNTVFVRCWRRVAHERAARELA